MGLTSATLAVTFPTGVFNFPVGSNLASADVSLGSVPLSDTASPGGAADWTLSANSPADGQLNITLTAQTGEGITTNNPATGGSLVTINFPVSATYNPASATAEAITVVTANGSVHTSILGSNGTYTLNPTPPYSGSITIHPPPLQVVPGSFAGTPSGFSLPFNAPFLVNSMTPVLYGQGFAATAPVPSVTLTGPNGPVEGSLVLNTATNSLTFVATNTASLANNGSPILPDGTYTVDRAQQRAPTGFQALNSGGGFLDGLGTGTPGSGDYTATFTVNAAAARR